MAEFVTPFLKEGPVWGIVAALIFSGLYLGRWQLDREKEARAEAVRFNNKMIETLESLNKLVNTLQGTMSVVSSSIALQEKEFEELRIIIMEKFKELQVSIVEIRSIVFRDYAKSHQQANDEARRLTERSIAPRDTNGH